MDEADGSISGYSSELDTLVYSKTCCQIPYCVDYLSNVNSVFLQKRIFPDFDQFSIMFYAFEASFIMPVSNNNSHVLLE